MDENKLKEMEIACKNCKNYIRFNKDHNSFRVLGRRGFCLYGQLEGDFTPYIGGGKPDCGGKGHVFSSENNVLWEHEKALRQKLADMLHAIMDRRTKEYKEIKPILDGIEEYKRVKRAKTGERYMIAWRIEEKVATDYFHQENWDEYQFLHNAVKLTQHDYYKFISQLIVEMHDRFCDCNKLELNLAKISEVSEEVI